MFGITFDIITVVHQAAITDWIQAVAALLAVPGAIAAFVVLFLRDKQKEAMIAELKKQTGHIGAQVDQLGAQVFQLKNIHEAIATGIEVLSNNAVMREKNRRNELRPYLVLAKTRTRPKSDRIEYEFFNRGGTANDVEIRGFRGEPEHVLNQLRAVAGQAIQVDIIDPEPIVKDWEFEFHYKDADGIAYQQRVVRKRTLGQDLEVFPP